MEELKEEIIDNFYSGERSISNLKIEISKLLANDYEKLKKGLKAHFLYLEESQIEKEINNEVAEEFYNYLLDLDVGIY